MTAETDNRHPSEDLVSEYIAGLQWSGDQSDHEETLVVGNIRAFAGYLRDQAQSVIDALPKTADGVPIVPDMTVYCIVGEHVDERRVLGPYGQRALLTHEPAQHGAGSGSAHRLAATVYADRDVAISQFKAEG